MRIDPLMPPQAYKTYVMRRPLATHWSAASCEDVDCPQFLNGWKTIVDEATPLGAKQAAYIRSDKTREHKEVRTPDGLTEFYFPAGNACFKRSEHKALNGRPSVYLVKGGDHRGNPLGTKTHVLTADQWRDDFGEHQDKLAEAIKRG